MKSLELDLHPYCKILPEMPKDEYLQLVESIREHGLRHPIRIDEENRIVDGRHRYRACTELGYEPRIEVLHLEGEELIEWIIDTNVARRHLTPSQRAMVDDRFVAELQALRESKGRSRADSNITREVAKKTGTPERSIKRAARVRQASPELADEVLDGRKTLHAAEIEVKARESQAALKGPIGPLVENKTKEPAKAPTDAEGNAIPARLVGAFSEGAKISAEVRKELLALSKRLEDCQFLDCATVARNLADLTGQIKLGVPALVCAKCSGAGFKESKPGVRDACRWCASRGWLPEHVRRAAKRSDG